MIKPCNTMAGFFMLLHPPIPSLSISHKQISHSLLSLYMLSEYTRKKIVLLVTRQHRAFCCVKTAGQTDIVNSVVYFHFIIFMYFHNMMWYDCWLCTVVKEYDSIICYYRYSKDAYILCLVENDDWACVRTKPKQTQSEKSMRTSKMKSCRTADCHDSNDCYEAIC